MGVQQAGALPCPPLPAVAAWSRRPQCRAQHVPAPVALPIRVFRHAAREHTLDIGRPLPVSAAVSVVGIDGTRVVQRRQRRIAGGIRRRAAQRNAAGQLDHQEGQADRHDFGACSAVSMSPGARRKARATASTEGAPDSGCGACNSAPFTSAPSRRSAIAPTRPPLRTRTRPARDVPTPPARAPAPPPCRHWDAPIGVAGEDIGDNVAIGHGTDPGWLRAPPAQGARTSCGRAISMGKVRPRRHAQSGRDCAITAWPPDYLLRDKGHDAVHECRVQAGEAMMRAVAAGFA